MKEKSKEYYLLLYKRTIITIGLLWLLLIAINYSEIYFSNYNPIERVLGYVNLILITFFMLPLCIVWYFYSKKLTKFGFSLSFSDWMYNKQKKYVQFYFKVSLTSLVVLLFAFTFLYEIYIPFPSSSILQIYLGNVVFILIPFILFGTVSTCLLFYFLINYDKHKLVSLK
jgi:hypothetical protein